MAICHRCGTENADDAASCYECGAPLGVRSGAELPQPPASYTPPHLTEKILRSRHAIAGERKHVTVVFCDVVGSTRLADELGPEAMHALVSDLFTVALDCVHRYEGTINQFLGDGFMAIFGAPIAHQDHAVRACAAATALRNAVAERQAHPSLEGWDRVSVRMGLNAGTVVVGGVGNDLRMDYTAVGDTTNVGARLEHAADPGQILIGASVAEAAGDSLELRDLEPVVVKGKDAPLVRYELIAVPDAATRTPRRGTRFVGRSTEWRTLNEAIDRARNGAGVVVHVEGEPGSGKSRLVMEFSDSLREDTRVAWGRCVSLGSQQPNAPVTGLVRDLCDLDPATSDDDITITKISGALGGSDEGADYLAALLGAPSSLERLRDVDPATLRGRTTESLVRLVGTSATADPLVLILEDLHWADASSLEFLSAVVSSAISTPLLLVATYRPGSTPPWEGLPHIQAIELGALSIDESEALVGGLPEAGLLSDDQRRIVLERGEGNPFFMEELARALAGGVVSEIPDNVLDVIAARIDRLHERDKDLLQTASVIGRDFAVDLLGEVAGAERSQLSSWLERVTQLGFIRHDEHPTRREFVHALTQQVAYEQMLTPQRQMLHSEVAERLTKIWRSAPEQACEEIARHYLAGTDAAQAIPFLELASTKAMRTHAMEEARDFFLTALSLLEAQDNTDDNIRHRVVVTLQHFPVFHFSHRHEEYHRLIERYAPIVAELGDPPTKGALLVQRGHRRWVFARYAEARAFLEEGRYLCEQAGDLASLAHAEQQLQWVDLWNGRYADSDRHGHEALDLLESISFPAVRMFTLVGLSLSAVWRGRWDEATTWTERVHEEGVVAGDDGLASFGSAFGSFAELSRGDIETSIALADRGLAEAPTVYFQGWSQLYKAAAVCQTDQIDAGASALSDVLEFVARSRHVSGYIVLVPLLAGAWLLMGRPDRARALAVPLETWAATADVPFVQASATALLGEADLAEGRPLPAADRFASAAEVFAAIGAENGRAQAVSGRGRALAAAGDVDAARPLLEEALATFEALGTLREPDRVRAALSSL